MTACGGEGTQLRSFLTYVLYECEFPASHTGRLQPMAGSRYPVKQYALLIAMPTLTRKKTEIACKTYTNNMKRILAKSPRFTNLTTSNLIHTNTKLEHYMFVYYYFPTT